MLFNFNMLLLYGLSMLVGGFNGGFSLKFFVVGNFVSLWNLVMVGGGGGSKVMGGGFIGFYRVSVNRSSNSSVNVFIIMWWSLLVFGMKWWFEIEVKEEVLGGVVVFFLYCGGGSSGIIVGKGELLFKVDVENLMLDECWRLIFKFGKYIIL